MPELTFVDEVGSTNDEVATWIRGGCADGVALCARRQVSGRGRQGRVWWAGDGGSLALSVAVVGPRYKGVMLQIPLAAGVGAVNALRSVGVVAGLKWPNDIYVSGRKLGGILCEAITDRDRFVGAVVGVGINVNIDRSEFPVELAESATSVQAECGHSPPVEEIAFAVHRDVVAALDGLARFGASSVLAAWRVADVTRGRMVRAGEFSGVAVDVSSDGGLVIEGADGRRQIVRAGEVVFAARSESLDGSGRDEG